MIRASARVAAVGLWLAAAWVALPARGQSGAQLDKYGWWNATQTLPADPSGGLAPPLSVPPPPSAPPDGLYIESAADGSPLAIAALAFFTGGGVDAALTLDLSEGATASGVTLAACPAGGGWDPVQNGRWDRRPTYDPAACTFLGTARGDTVVFRIPAAAHEPGSQFLSVAIVPAEGSGAFSASFDPPTNDSMTTSASASGAPSAPSPAAPVYIPGPVTFGTPDYAVPVDPVTGVTIAPTVTTAQPRSAAAPRRAAASEKGGTADRALAALLLLVGGAGLWFYAQQSHRRPRLLGALVEAED